MKKNAFLAHILLAAGLAMTAPAVSVEAGQRPRAGPGVAAPVGWNDICRDQGMAAYRSVERTRLIQRTLDCFSPPTTSAERIIEESRTPPAPASRKVTRSDLLKMPSEPLSLPPRKKTPPAAAAPASDERPPTVHRRLSAPEPPLEDKRRFRRPRPKQERPLRYIEAGLEIQRYHYEQKSHWPYFYYLLYNDPLQMTNDGTRFGGFASYVYRLSHNRPVRSLREVFQKPNKINFLKFDAHLVKGTVNRDISYEDEQKDFGMVDADIRGLVGYDFPSRDYTLMVTPYTGLGFRYVHADDIGDWVDAALENWNYDREMRYLYLPIGVTVEKDIDAKWQIGMSFEYDIMLWGRLQSHFEDCGYTITGSGTAAGKMLRIDEITNHQDDGFGIRFAARVVRKHEPFDIFVEPFVRYWDVRATDPKRYEATAEDGSQYYFTRLGDSTNVIEHYEPANKTTEYGLRMGIKY